MRGRAHEKLEILAEVERSGGHVQRFGVGLEQRLVVAVLRDLGDLLYFAHEQIL